MRPLRCATLLDYVVMEVPSIFSYVAYSKHELSLNESGGLLTEENAYSATRLTCNNSSLNYTEQQITNAAVLTCNP